MICASCGETIEPNPAPCPRCGDEPLLEGRYRLLEPLGRGAVGATYRAERVADGAILAVKEILVRRLDSFKTEALFMREARVLSELDHEAIPAFVEQFTAGTGRHIGHYLVFEFVDGVTLADELTTQRYEAREVLAVLAQVLDILAYLHRRQPPVIHRDVKPANIMRRRADGRLLLIDFGAVRDVLKGSLGGSTVTGTIGYMAPEQFSGQSVCATDIYALGVTAVSLLTRTHPTELTDVDHRLRWEPAVAVAPAVRQLLGDMLERDPTRRAGDALALKARIEALLDDDEAIAAPPTALRAVPSAPREVPRAFLERVAPEEPPLPSFVRPVALLGLGLALAALVFGRWAVSRGWFVAGGLGLLAGAGAAFALWRRGRRRRRLERAWRDGVATTAEVLDVALDPGIRLQGRSPWVIRYRFEAAGRDVEGRTYAWREPGEARRPGARVRVLYLESDPTVSVLYPLE